MRDDLFGGFEHTVELDDGTARTSELYVTWDGRYLVGHSDGGGLEVVFETEGEVRGDYDEDECFVSDETGPAHLRVDWFRELAGVSVAQLVGAERIESVDVFQDPSERALRPEVTRDASGVVVRRSFTTAYLVDDEVVRVRHTLTRR